MNWDHVGIFIVRSRSGRDFHLAKDGDENTTGLQQESRPSGHDFAGLVVRWLHGAPTL